jgi:hypothetical protein
MSSPTPPHLTRQRAAQGYLVEAAAHWHRDSLLPARTRSVPGMPADAIDCAESLVRLRELALLKAVGEFLKQL